MPLGAVGWGMVAAAGVQAAGGLLADDNGAQGANDSQAALNRTNAEIQKDQYYGTYKPYYEPLERDLITEARNTDSPSEIARVEGEANADVTGSFNRSRLENADRMRAMGVNPGSGAWQSMDASTGIAEAGTRAGALKMARDTLKETGYARRFALAQMGRNIPSSVSSGLSNISSSEGSRAARLTGDANADRANTAYALAPIANAAREGVTKNWNSWTSNPSSGPAKGSTSGFTDPNSDYGSSFEPYGFKKGGRVRLMRRRAAHHLAKHILKHYAEGGRVSDAVWERDEVRVGRYYDKEGADGTGLQYNGSSVSIGDNESDRGDHFRLESVARKQNAMPRKKMAGGGAVDASEQGQLDGPGTPTSDSIPAVIDGKQPAALSTDEFVMNAGVSKLSALEILDAINKRGLQKRGDAPAANDAQVPLEEQPKPQGMKRGGRVALSGGRC